MVKKYKCIKRYCDGGPEIGSIAKFNRLEGAYFVNNKKTHYISKKGVENYPEFWAEYLFTTEDGVDIFKGDTFYNCLGVVEPVLIDTEHFTNVPDVSYAMFASKKKAQEYLDSLKPNFEEGVWYKHRNIGALVLFKNFGKTNPGFYTIGWTESIPITEKSRCWTKADPKEVEKLLIKEANKRYSKEVKFKSMLTNKEDCLFISQGEFQLSPNLDMIWLTGGGFVYKGGEWTEIVEEPKYYWGVCPNAEWDIWDKAEIDPTKKVEWIWFESEKERDEYIVENKPQYSKKELIKFGKFAKNYRSGKVVEKAFNKWKNELERKN